MTRRVPLMLSAFGVGLPLCAQHKQCARLTSQIAFSVPYTFRAVHWLGSSMCCSFAKKELLLFAELFPSSHPFSLSYLLRQAFLDH